VVVSNILFIDLSSYL